MGQRRDEAVDLAKRFGGRVVGQPSSKTDFVVLGDNAGPSKLAAIKKHNLRTMSEDEFLNLIGTRKGLGNGKVDEKTKRKTEKEQETIRQAAKEMEKREEKGNSAKKDSGRSVVATLDDKVCPTVVEGVLWQQGQVEKLQQWFHDWPSSLKSGFKKPGQYGMNVFCAVMITGSPGIGKTTMIHEAKKLVETGMNINNTSLDGFVHGPSSTNSLGITITDKTCLIMDEVDGMSAGDRGGVGALNALIKKSKAAHIRSRILIAFKYVLYVGNWHRSCYVHKEKMKVPGNVIDQLITGAQSDIRQVLNMLLTWKLSSDKMDFDEGKKLAKMNEKYSIMSPFGLTSKMLGPYLFSPTSRETLRDKMEIFPGPFVHALVHPGKLPQDGACKTAQYGRSREKALKSLWLMDRAASSISDGDLVDALIHGPEQHWSLMPLHAVCSTVRPAAALYGMGAHYGGPNACHSPNGWDRTRSSPS
ncbi:hypothetical protein L208DRAFT_1374307 [Tricholoma matsutake]|nr:hypothetical protein L208DRAFT_1374307 [Tricholoma matsutake 945]